MEQNILISVIIPTLNSGLYLEECINSVINQTYKNFEIIVVDGGSTDNTIVILNKYSSKTNFKVFSTKACVSLQRNYGLEQAGGDYVFFLDSDDYLDENFLEEILFTSLSKKLDVVTPSFELDLYENNKLISKSSNKFILEDALVTKDNFFDNGYGAYIGTQCKLYKKIILKNINKYNNVNFGEDLLFNYSITQCHSFYYGIASKAIYHYRKLININDAGKRLNKLSLNFFPIFLKFLKNIPKSTNNYNGAFNIFVDNVKAFMNAYIAQKTKIPVILFKSRVYIFCNCTGKKRIYFIFPRLYKHLIKRKAKHK